MSETKTLKSLDDLRRLREEAHRDIRVREATGTKIIIGMGTCGIAAGARETMKAILNYIEKENLTGVVVTQTGCIGMCEREPIVQVETGEGSLVTYGRVTPEQAERIMREHVTGGKVVTDLVVPV